MFDSVDGCDMCEIFDSICHECFRDRWLALGVWDSLDDGRILVYQDAHSRVVWNTSATFNVFSRYGIETDVFTHYGINSMADASMVAGAWLEGSMQHA